MSWVNVGKEALPDGFLTGNGVVGTVEAKISAVDFPVQKHIVIRANAGNTDVIKVGPPGHAASGFILAEGETTPPIHVDSTGKVAVIGGGADQAYSWMSI